MVVAAAAAIFLPRIGCAARGGKVPAIIREKRCGHEGHSDGLEEELQPGGYLGHSLLPCNSHGRGQKARVPLNSVHPFGDGLGEGVANQHERLLAAAEVPRVRQIARQPIVGRVNGQRRRVGLALQVEHTARYAAREEVVCKRQGLKGTWECEVLRNAPGEAVVVERQADEVGPEVVDWGREVELVVFM